jgi:hypothetical protein
MNRAAWIDWNIDGDFDDQGELLGTRNRCLNFVLGTHLLRSFDCNPGFYQNACSYFFRWNA